MYIPFPAGIKVGWGGTIASVPKGFLYCNGAAINRVQFANLFAAIGVIWGAGDGSTTFNLPDCRNRVQMGADADTNISCVVKPTSSVIGGTLQCGGSATHCHSFSGVVDAHTHSYSGSVSGDTSGPSHSVCAECYFSTSACVADGSHTHSFSANFSGTTGASCSSLSGSTCNTTDVPPFAAFPEIIKV